MKQLSGWLHFIQGLAVAAIACMSLLALPGCATQADGQRATEGMADLVTDSDESPERKRARIRVELALGYFQQGKTTIALDEIKLAIQADPNFFDAQNLRGLIYLSLNDAGLAENSFNKALAIRPNNPDVLHNLGWLKCQQGQYAHAANYFTQALANPRYLERAKTWMTLGLCQQSAGQLQSAEQSLLKSYELDAGHPVTAYNLALLLHQNGEDQRAQFYIRRLNNSDLANAESLWLGMRIERRLGQREVVEQLGVQLEKRYPQAPQTSAYRRGAFDE